MTMPKTKQNKSPNPSFRCYIDGNGEIKDFVKPKSVFHGHELDRGKHVEPVFLKGEAVIGTTHNVLRYTSFHADGTQGSGIVGVLYVTNFRLKFCVAATDEEEKCNRNKLIGEDDIVLNCIDAIYQVSKGKRKKLLPQTGSSGTVKTIEIHCKGFQIHSFSFKMCEKDDAKKTVNAMVHHSFPLRLDLLFAFDFEVSAAPENGDPQTPRFDLESDWQSEVDRLKVSGFKVLHCNANFQNCQSLPEMMVVPNTLDLPDLKNYSNHFVDHRWPIWSYTYRNGASLVRMANVIAKSYDTDMENRILDKIRLTHPKSKKPAMFDFNELQQNQTLPTIKEIQSSYDKLRDKCMPSKKKDLVNSDNTWYSSLDNCGWFQVISKCLETALKAINSMVNKGETVILKENNSRDITPLISCLVQLMLDPYYRTIQGFQTLVEKEWVALGHNFTERMGLLVGSDPCPLFVLFLDCVWQLHLQFPSAFQFSEVYLITLWDTACLGLFDNFIFDCILKRQTVAKGFRQYNSTKFNFLSAWEWSRQFDKENTALFNNPLYVARTELKLSIPTHHTGSSSGEEIQLKRVYSRKLADIHEVIPKQDINILRPFPRLPMLKFWSHCYLRWVSHLEIIGGGSPSEYLQQCLLVEEILCLKHQVHSLKTDTEFVRSARPRSDLLFSFDVSNSNRSSNGENTVTSARWSERVAVTSSFPYRSTMSCSHLSPTDTSISLFLENSFIQESDDDIDSESVDGLDLSNSLAVTMIT